MNLKGTKFQKKVWNYLKTIPKGKIKTFGEMSRKVKYKMDHRFKAFKKIKRFL